MSILSKFKPDRLKSLSKLKLLIMISPFFLISSTLIYKSIIQIEWSDNIRFVWYISGAIILSIGLSILDNKSNEK